MVSAVVFFATGPCTVKADVPVATVLSAFVKMAATVAVPGLTAVASPVEALMLTIPALLELHAT